METTGNFEPVPGAKHRIGFDDGVEWISVRATRNWLVLLFLAFWLTGWTAGGIAAITAVAQGQDRGFLVIWLTFWALGWVFAASTVLWQIGGKTRVGVAGGALVHRWSMPLVSRTKNYDVSQVRRVRATTSSLSGLFGMFGRNPYPPFIPTMGWGAGSLAFDYGSRTVRLLPEIDQPEAAMVADWPARRLPAGAVG